MGSLGSSQCSQLASTCIWVTAQTEGKAVTSELEGNKHVHAQLGITPLAFGTISCSTSMAADIKVGK